MKKITSVVIITIISLGSLFILIKMKESYNKNEEIPFLSSIEGNPNMDFEYTYTNYSIRKAYPKDLNVTRKLLTEIVGKENVVNGVIKQPSIYVKPFGRLGNSIVQVSNAIYLAEIMNVSTIYMQKNFCFIKNNITTSKGIKIVPTVGVPKESLGMYQSLFMLSASGHCPENRVYEFASETLKGIPHVNTNDDGLYIHVRSGDIFKENPSKWYGQPPMCFYESIIEKLGFKNIYVITEDRKNPVINALIEKYNATLVITDLLQTIGLILGAKNFVVSFGTFVPSLLKLLPDDTEKNIFRYGNEFNYLTDIWKEFYFTEPSKLYKNTIMGSNWKNTKEQREIMMNETCGDVWKVSMYTKYVYD